MQLTAIEFAKLINDLKCDVRPDERRENPRAPTRAIVDVIQIDAAATGAAKRQKLRVRDISRTGLGLLINRSLPDNSRVLVLMPKGEGILVLLCDVVRCQRLPGDMYHVGAKMVRRLTNEEFARFLKGEPGGAAALLTDAAPALTPAA